MTVKPTAYSCTLRTMATDHGGRSVRPRVLEAEGAAVGVRKGLGTSGILTKEDYFMRHRGIFRSVGASLLPR